jgi:Ca2+-binding EF-hand superfamily protein
MSGPSEDEIRVVFDQFDADGSGFIDAAEIRAICEQLGVTPPYEDVYNIVAEADDNNDGKVSFDEFMKIIDRA